MEFFNLVVIVSALICHFVSWDLQKKQVKQIKNKLQTVSDKEDLSFIREINADSSRLPLSASISTIAIWLEIFGMVLLASVHFLIPLVVILLIAIRFRVLQETTHFLIHTNKLYAWLLSDLLFHFPTGKDRATLRRDRHMQHHSGTVSIRDPNLVSTAQPLAKLFNRRFARTRVLLYPLGPTQFFRRTLSLVTQVYEDFISSWKTSFKRLVGFSIFVALTYFASGSWRAWLGLIVVPIFVLFPMLSWWGELCEHRWLSRPRKGVSKIEREILLSNVVIGKILPKILLPWGDRFHLIHTINPQLCPRSMKILHKDLFSSSTSYSKQFVLGFKICRSSYPTVLTILLADAQKLDTIDLADNRDSIVLKDAIPDHTDTS